ncbi:MFS transporter [Stakelama sp. CBK3Z-3]|uniref:MFS transporter n=1 Tax=Stakelama flava TaxID=2860338 RepID=A0ABS6XLV1_9SPHN|nr:MFS transporter [Stakelama flava]MBW4331166.1 MFS transporter [Stakelama flava]
MTQRDAPRATHPGLVLLALAMGGFAIGTTEFATMSLLPYFASDLGIDAPTASHVISAYALGVVVGAPLLAVVSARVERRLLLIGLMALFAIGNALSALASSYSMMMLVRFISGVPHGAYFGIASLMAASLVPAERRTWAVSRVMLGLTIATIAGVPFANALGQWVGWRWGFVVVAALALATIALIRIFAPRQLPDRDVSPLSELDALKRRQVWLTLGIGAVGFGGMFAVYTYLASTLVEVTGVSAALIPVYLAIFGAGMTIGNLFIPYFADRALMPTAAGVLIWAIAVTLLYPIAAHNSWAMGAIVFLIGIVGALGAILQTRLMDVAGDAQSLAAALNHSAFNTANALGPWLAGMAIAAGFGWASSGLVGAALGAGGLLVWLVAALDARRQAATPLPA